MPADIYPIKWLGVIVVILAPMTGWEAFLGHYRSGFSLRAQYAPLVTAVALTAGGAATIFSPVRFATALQVAGWIGLVSGLIGAAYHHYYGIVEKPGGYRWLLHQLIIHAPPLAPLSHSALGALLILSGLLASGTATTAGFPIASLISSVCAITILGAAAQAGLLHYRGAYNNALMYLPITIPVVAVVAIVWQVLAPSPIGTRIAVITLWMTFITGFVGAGMHICGIDRQMGGFYIGIPNMMQGPPISAPLVFSAFAGAALAALHLG
jgi:hypothetical protein